MITGQKGWAEKFIIVLLETNHSALRASPLDRGVLEIKTLRVHGIKAPC